MLRRGSVVAGGIYRAGVPVTMVSGQKAKSSS